MKRESVGPFLRFWTPVVGWVLVLDLVGTWGAKA